MDFLEQNTQEEDIDVIINGLINDDKQDDSLHEVKHIDLEDYDTRRSPKHRKTFSDEAPNFNPSTRNPGTEEGKLEMLKSTIS